MFETLRADIERAMRQARPDDWTPTWKHKIEVCLRHATWPVIAYRYGHWTLGVRIPVIGQLLRVSGLIFRKVTGCFRSQWGAEVYAAAASVIATGRITERPTRDTIPVAAEEQLAHAEAVGAPAKTFHLHDGEALAARTGITGVDWQQFADEWRGAYAPSMNRVRTGELPWTNLDALHRMALDELLDKFAIAGKLTEEDKVWFNLTWHRLRPWPDSVPGLTRIKRKFIIGEDGKPPGELKKKKKS